MFPQWTACSIGCRNCARQISFSIHSATWYGPVHWGAMAASTQSSSWCAEQGKICKLSQGPRGCKVVYLQHSGRATFASFLQSIVLLWPVLGTFLRLHSFMQSLAGLFCGYETDIGDHMTIWLTWHHGGALRIAGCGEVHHSLQTWLV